MIKKDYEYCPKCGCIVGEYIIKEGMGGIGVTQEMFCDNYCRVCGEKIDAIGFKNKVDNLAKDILETKKQIEDILLKDAKKVILKTEKMPVSALLKEENMY